jgi:hypothetical protein
VRNFHSDRLKVNDASGSPIVEMLLTEQARRAGRLPERADDPRAKRRGLDSGP